ncbi:MFS transporter [Staphylococcus pasteuri]|uniref:MFS transporter n=1 Tax=Staphylococcus pasteuri TaxID=45972 RepID=UPI000E69018F|nr:MFS transporter [Staphylococcus pasteuri]MCT1926885.1 MFS transporter [Staphylococcus pasteuri]QQT10254.1 MFS transporter [Staphylococcus pasteuri]RIO54158.1 MFS transporter [Staphylococcus pasteuri]
MSIKVNKFDGSLVLAACFAVLTYWMFAQSFINIGSSVQHTFDTTDATKNLSISLVGFVTGIFMVCAGDVADKIGNLRMTKLGLLFSIIGCLSLISTHITAFLIIGRAFQGLSAAILLPSTIGLVTDHFKGQQLRKAYSYLMIATVGGIGLTSYVGGWLSGHLGWQSIFIVSIVLSIIALIILRNKQEAPREERNHQPFDYVGMVLFGIFIAALMILMTQGYTYGIGKFTITLVVIIVIALLIFYFYEKKKTVPFIDFSIIKNKSFLGATINNFVVNTGTGTTVVFNGYAQQQLGLNEAQTGLVIVPYTIMAILMIRFGELAIKRFGGKSMLIAGPLFPTLGIILISMTFFVPHWYVGVVVVAFVICAIGNGLVATPGLTVAVFNMPDDKVSFATGLYKMGATLGMAFGVAINTTIFTVCSQFYPIATAASISFLTGAVMMVLGVISAFILIPKNVKA